jgi:hypothetical protein
MIRDKERIIQEKTDKVSQIVKDYIEEMDTLSETDRFTIDNIEKLWEGLDESTREVYKEIGREIIEQIDERKAIRAKKVNTKRKV